MLAQDSKFAWRAISGLLAAAALTMAHPASSASFLTAWGFDGLATVTGGPGGDPSLPKVGDSFIIGAGIVFPFAPAFTTDTVGEFHFDASPTIPPPFGEIRTDILILGTDELNGPGSTVTFTLDHGVMTHFSMFNTDFGCCSASVSDHAFSFDAGFLVSGPYAISGTVTVLHQGVTTFTVPEPASWTLMTAGFGLVGAVIRRRRSAAILPGIT